MYILSGWGGGVVRPARSRADDDLPRMHAPVLTNLPRRCQDIPVCEPTPRPLNRFDAARYSVQLLAAALLLGVSARAAAQEEAGPEEISDDALGALLGGGGGGGESGAPTPGGAGFFDPARLVEARSLSINGYTDATAFTPLTRRRLGEVGFADASLGLFFGAPIYGDSVYASAVLETGVHTLGTGGQLQIESAGLVWSPRSWFKLGGGAFVVPFGLEDAEHASPQNPLITRPLSFSGGVVYPGTWSTVGAWAQVAAPGWGEARLFVVGGDPVHRRQDVQASLALATQASALELEGGGGELRTREQAHGFSGSLRSLDATRRRTLGARLQLDEAVEGLDLGASAMWGQHGHAQDAAGLDLYHVGGAAHLDVDLGALLTAPLGAVLPLPRLRAEAVWLVEDEARVDLVNLGAYTLGSRQRYGYYATVAQRLLEGLDLLVRYDEFDPDLDAPGDRGLTFAVGLRWIPVPNVVLKAETLWTDDQGRAQVGANSGALQGAVAW